MYGAVLKNSLRRNSPFHEQRIASYSAAPEEMKTGARTASHDIEHATPSLAQEDVTRRYTARHNDLTLNDNPPNFVIE